MRNKLSLLQWHIHAYRSTVGICARQVFDGNLLCVAGEYLVRFVQMALLILVWKALAAQGADLGGLTLPQLLTYTLMASVLRQQLEIVTPATSALWEGSIIGRFTRPMPVIGSMIAETIGRWWIPVFLFYSLPVWLLSPLGGVNPLPATALDGALAAGSLALSASLGFALDLLFAALAIWMKNGCWAAMQVRESIFALLSGALIPFSLLPWGLDRLFALLPFGSIASAPLQLYTGTAAEPGKLLLLQVFWNLALWSAAILVTQKSQERMISYGG